LASRDGAGEARIWELFVLEYARANRQPIASLIQGAFQDGTIDTPFSFVLARNGTRTVLVDTGFMKEGNGEVMAARFDVPHWISPLRLLAEMGVAPGDVTDIVLSHAHFDHMGSIEQFPKARLYLQKRELLSWVEAMALPRQFGFLTQVLDPDDIHAALAAAAEHRLVLLDGDKDDVLPGIHVRSGEGHTIGQQFAIVETAAGTYVVSGDCVYGRRNLTGLANDGVYTPLGAGIGSVWDQLKTMDRIHQAVGGDISRVIILHDFERWPQFAVVKEIDGFRICRVA
jgi:glyoxylase-like metal-dependent hydrolase (beta-lactamase superfamily II)